MSFLIDANIKKIFITFALNNQRFMDIIRYLKKFPITILLTLIILYVCLMDIPKTPLSSIAFIDKWTHIAIFFIYSMTIAHEYFHSRKKIKVKLTKFSAWVFIYPILFGGLIELLQAYCTSNRRNGEWLDLLADAIGCALGWLIGTLLVKYLSKP